MNATDSLFFIVILIMSVVIHEVSHGFMAESFGDDTAREAGRLTLNPIPHIDIFGSIILPGLLILAGAIPIGWAKPVPFDPRKLSNKRWGTIAIALAGIGANFFIALVFGLIIRFGPKPVSDNFITETIVFINIALGLFNLIPIPPLDGSKIILPLLPERVANMVYRYELYFFILLVLLVYVFGDYLSPAVFYIFHLFTGV